MFIVKEPQYFIIIRLSARKVIQFQKFHFEYYCTNRSELGVFCYRRNVLSVIISKTAVFLFDTLLFFLYNSCLILINSKLTSYREIMLPHMNTFKNSLLPISDLSYQTVIYLLTFPRVILIALLIFHENVLSSYQLYMSVLPPVSLPACEMKLHLSVTLSYLRIPLVACSTLHITELDI